MLINLGDIAVRSWRKADIDSLVRHANNQRIADNLRDQFPYPYTRRAAIDYLDFAREQSPERSFAIEHAGEAVRGIGFQIGIDIARVSAEIGYWLSEEYWGRGLTTRAVQACSEWAFDRYNLTRLFALVFAYNQPSMRVLEKAGFEREAVLRRSAIKNGVILDQVMYAKVR